jgi:hypothetical protein
MSLTFAQIPRGEKEIKNYLRLLAPVAKGNLEQIQHLISPGTDLEQRDAHERTPLVVAAHLSFNEIAGYIP